MEEKIKKLRTVRSFVKRKGKIGVIRKQAKEAYSSLYLIDLNNAELLNFASIFKNTKETIVEIGFGMGDSLIQMAKDNPDINYIGIEVHEAGVANIILQIHENKLENLKIIQYDALEVFEKYLTDDSLAGLQIFFPDPWHKRKHHKRRIINQKNLEIFAKKLKKSKTLHFATDWEDYALITLKLLKENDKIFKNKFDEFAPRPKWRPLTRFEKRGEKLQHKIYDILFCKV